jgi:hypothetical protein
VVNPTYKRWKVRDFNMKTAGLLRFGYRWTEWQALKAEYTCFSRRSGLTCRIRSGQGWWLGRYKGYRVF